MRSLFSLSSIFLYTPLEQFDDVAFVGNRVIERREPYALYVLEREYVAEGLYANSFASASTFSTVRLSGGLWLVLLVPLLWSRRPAALSTSTFNLTALTGGFSHLTFLAILHILTGCFLTFCVADLFYPRAISANLEALSFAFAPQLDLSFYLDERRVTLLLAFFLLGAGEENDEEDFLLSEEGDLDVEEEIVAPIFLSNLGSKFAENGALYLTVTSLFAFVLSTNLRGRLPYSDTATSSLALTIWTSLAVFSGLIALRIRKHGVTYLFGLFRPAGCPLPLLLLLVPIEAISYSFRVISLAVRLFANRRAGHTLRKVLIGFSYVFLTLGDLYALAAFLPGLVVFILVFLERGVAAIQAYIFRTLVIIYRKDIYVAHSSD